MKINKWRQKYLYVYLFHASSALIKLRQLSQAWLLNCPEGCQHDLIRKRIKITQIKSIVLTHNSLANISGLLGLLSTISLNNGVSRIDIYGPKHLNKYIFWCRKYSKTNFRYNLYFHDISCNKIAYQSNLQTCFMYNYQNKYFNCSMVNSERTGMFNKDNAIKHSVPRGYLYSCFKKGQNFILPDGYIVQSKDFIRGYYLGSKATLINSTIRKREMTMVKNTVYVMH